MIFLTTYWEREKTCNSCHLKIRIWYKDVDILLSLKNWKLCNTGINILYKNNGLFHLEGVISLVSPRIIYFLSFPPFMWYHFVHLHDRFGIYRHLNVQLLYCGLKSSSLASYMSTISLLLTSWGSFLRFSFSWTLYSKNMGSPKTLWFLPFLGLPVYPQSFPHILNSFSLLESVPLISPECNHSLLVFCFWTLYILPCLIIFLYILLICVREGETFLWGNPSFEEGQLWQFAQELKLSLLEPDKSVQSFSQGTGTGTIRTERGGKFQIENFFK